MNYFSKIIVLSAVDQYRLDGYDDDIKNAYDSELIDTYIHGTYEDVMKDRSSPPNAKRLTGIENLSQLFDYGNANSNHLSIGSFPGVDIKITELSSSSLEEHKKKFKNFDSFDVESKDNFTYTTHDHPQPVKLSTTKVKRNDPCPCGSGKKYKKCCWNK